MDEILEARQRFFLECALSACCIIQTIPDMLVVLQPPAQWQHLSPLSSRESVLFKSMWLNASLFCADGCHSVCMQCRICTLFWSQASGSWEKTYSLKQKLSALPLPVFNRKIKCLGDALMMWDISTGVKKKSWHYIFKSFVCYMKWKRTMVGHLQCQSREIY